MTTYWFDSPQQWQLIQEVQQLKRQELDLIWPASSRSDDYVMVNPVTHQTPTVEDLEYARDHLSELISSGEIRDERWAFLWYH